MLRKGSGLAAEVRDREFEAEFGELLGRGIARFQVPAPVGVVIVLEPFKGLPGDHAPLHRPVRDRFFHETDREPVVVPGEALPCRAAADHVPLPFGDPAGVLVGEVPARRGVHGLVGVLADPERPPEGLAQVAQECPSPSRLPIFSVMASMASAFPKRRSIPYSSPISSALQRASMESTQQMLPKP